VPLSSGALLFEILDAIKPGTIELAKKMRDDALGKKQN